MLRSDLHPGAKAELNWANQQTCAGERLPVEPTLSNIHADETVKPQRIHPCIHPSMFWAFWGLNESTCGVVCYHLPQTATRNQTVEVRAAAYLQNLHTRTCKHMWNEPAVHGMKGGNTDQICGVVITPGFGRCSTVIWKINQSRINKQVLLAEDHSAPPACAKVTQPHGCSRRCKFHPK